jgi:hypothetical protein
MKISLSLHEVLALIDGDDTLTAERGWLIRNTFAAAECTVIRPELAAAIRALDPSGAVIHVQSYSAPDAPAAQVHTAWTPITWAESSERRRLAQLNNSQWRAEQRAKEECYTAAVDFADRLNRLVGFNKKQYTAVFVQTAEQLRFNVDDFNAYLKEIDNKFNITTHEQALKGIHQTAPGAGAAQEKDSAGGGQSAPRDGQSH